MSRLRSGLALAVTTLLAATGGGAAGDALRVEYRADQLAMRAAAVPLQEVLDAVAAATGATVQGTPLENRSVSIEIEALPLDAALHRILGVQNFTLRYRGDGRPSVIVLLGGPEAASAPSDRPTAAGVAVVPSTLPPAPAGFPLALSRALQRARPVPLPESLAEALGTDRATLPQLLDLATDDGDGLRRAEATQAVLSAFERQSRLRRAFLRTLHGLDDASLEAIVAAEGGPRFVGVLDYLAAHSRETALQKKAAVLLERVRPAPPAPAGGY